MRPLCARLVIDEDADGSRQRGLLDSRNGIKALRQRSLIMSTSAAQSPHMLRKGAGLEAETH